MNDPFAILGLPRSFELSTRAIEAAFLSRAASLHPDLVGDDPAIGGQAADLNDARALLLDPESRANALLELIGGPSKERDRSLPDGFLIEVLETREAIETAAASNDEAAIRTWHTWAAQERASYIAQAAAAFAISHPDLSALRRLLNAWRYIERLVAQLPASPDSGKEGAR